jgi:hypothetical protein
MIKFLHIAAISALIASAGYAYSVKYETLFHAEQVAKLKAKAQREREVIAVLKAEWQHLNRPDRLQAAADRHLLDMQPLSVAQLGRFSELPNRPPREDTIGRKLELLMGPTATPKPSGTETRTSTTQTPKR